MMISGNAEINLSNEISAIKLGIELWIFKKKC